MTVSDREPSPFSGTGLNKGRKKAFATVAVLAALSCGWAGYGFYIDFLRVLPATATFYLTTADRMTRVSLLNPQPPEIREREKNAATETQADNPPAALFQQVRDLHEQQDAAAQKKIDEIDSLEKERTELENKKRQVLNDLENALAAFKQDGENENAAVPALDEKPPAALSAKQTKEPVTAAYRGNMQPNLIQGEFMSSLPDFGSIKKGAPANAVPLSIIDPLPELRQKSHGVLLPVKTKANTPFSAYSKPLAIPPAGPYIAVLFTGLGKRANATEAAINTLPDVVSLSFSPYAHDLKKYVENARETGHETLLNLPMQQGVFPDTDPGPLGLVSGLPEHENRKRLHKVLGRDVAFIGVAASPNETFSLPASRLKPFVDELNARGLIYVDGTDDKSLPKPEQVIRPDVHIADNFHRAAINARLEQARRIALTKGSALVRVETVPITLLTVEKWIKELTGHENPADNMAFVPLSYYILKHEADK